MVPSLMFVRPVVLTEVKRPYGGTNRTLLYISYLTAVAASLVGPPSITLGLRILVQPAKQASPIGQLCKQ